jgi:hypothetical protein
MALSRDLANSLSGGLPNGPSPDLVAPIEVTPT